MKNKKTMALKIKRFPADGDSFPKDAITYIRSALQKIGLSEKQMESTIQLCEETIGTLMKYRTPGAPLYVRIRKYFGGETRVYLTMKGEAFDPYYISADVTEYTEEPEETASADEMNETEEADDTVSASSARSVLFRSHGEYFKYKHTNRYNRVRILTEIGSRSMNNAAFIALALGVVFGLLVKFAFPPEMTDGLCRFILDPFSTMFMNALNIIIAPVVFFSITTCISQFGSLKELGKMGGKVIGMYFLTTLIAITIGIGLSLLIAPGEWGFALTSGIDVAPVAVDTNVDTSLLATIINIVPSNFIRPFLESNTLQIMFLAVLVGAAVGMIGQYSSMIKELLEALNSLFLTITTIITKLIPVAVFVSLSLMIINTDGASILSVAGVAGVQGLAVGCMLCAYGLLVLFMGRLNPFTFFKKAKEGMLTSFSLSSSAAAMPTNMRICTEKLGIAPKVANFSIPLGATINMDGTCIYLSVLSLFLARAYAVEITPAQIASVAVTIILLSLGAPGVPGVGLVCLGIVLEILKVPVGAIGLILAINPILDMLDTMNNTTGDMAAALIVAKSEHLLDMAKYNAVS